MNNNKNGIKMSFSYREIIEKNGFYIATPVGTSMLPLLRERIDTVKIVKVDRKLEKGDVILYERPNNVFVLHRIVGIKKNKQEEKYILCGDNQTNLEKYVTIDQVIGVMDGYYKEETYISIQNEDYKTYVKRRIRSRIRRKVRLFLGKIYHKIFKKKK